MDEHVGPIGAGRPSRWALNRISRYSVFMKNRCENPNFHKVIALHSSAVFKN